MRSRSSLWPLALTLAVGCAAPTAGPEPAAPPAAGDARRDAAATAVDPAGGTASALPADAASAGQPMAPGAAVAPPIEEAVGSGPTLDPDRDFTPTDPASVQLAAGRPQLIEFYAEW